MINITFLDKIASILIENYSDKLSTITVVLPNKRAKVFLINALKNKTQVNILAPNIVSIEDFVQDIAGVRSLDSIEILFEFLQIRKRPLL